MAESIDIMRSFGGFVATQLTTITGDKWAVEDAGAVDNAWTVNLVCDAHGAKIFVRPMNFGNRVKLTGNYPSSTVWPIPQTVAITVSRDKAPGTIARDIVRRLLPEYLKELQRVAEGNALDAEQLKAREAAYESLSKVIPLDRGRTEPKLSDTRWVADFRRPQAEGNDVRGEVTCNAWGSRYDLDLSGLKIDHVAAILRIIADV